MTEENAAAKADGIEEPRQDFGRLAGHVIERTRQRHGRGAAVAGAGIDEDAGPRRLRELLREIAPEAHGAKPLVQNHDGGRLVRARADHAVFEPRAVDLEKAFVRKWHSILLASSSAGACFKARLRLAPQHEDVCVRPDTLRVRFFLRPRSQTPHPEARAERASK